VAESSERDRIDKWLWAVRLYKTRSLATDACRAGSVAVNGQSAKPSRAVHPGEVVGVRQGLIQRTLVVRAVPAGRVGPKLVPAFCEDRTPPAEFEKARGQRVQQILARARGLGRPTKRDRRMIDRIFGSQV